MKRLFSLFCAAVLFAAFPSEIPVFAADPAQTFGENITLELVGDTLYLNGTGATD